MVLKSNPIDLEELATWAAIIITSGVLSVIFGESSPS